MGLGKDDLGGPDIFKGFGASIEGMSGLSLPTYVGRSLPNKNYPNLPGPGGGGVSGSF